MTGILTNRKNLETDKHRERTPCDDEGRNLSDVYPSQRCQQTPAARREVWNRFSSTRSGGTNPNIQISGFWIPGLRLHTSTGEARQFMILLQPIKQTDIVPLLEN